MPDSELWAERRLPRLIGLDDDVAGRFGRFSVAVVGAGSVGRRAALHLCRMGVGALAKVDRGRYKPESLLTQDIGRRDLGRSKAGATARAGRSVGGPTRILAFDSAVEDLDEFALADFDAVFLATDNLAAEIEVARRCIRTGQPLVQASVCGEALVAQVRLLARPGKGPCPACAFSTDEWQALDRDTRFSCEGGRATSAPRDDGPPTMSFSFLCSLAADLGLNQLLRLRVGAGAPVDDTLLEFCGFTNRSVVTPLRRNPGCPMDHTQFETRRVGGPLAEMTPGRLITDSGLSAPDGASFIVQGHTWVQSGRCPAGHDRRIDRFVRDGAPLGQCDQCDGRVQASPFHSFTAVPAGLADPDRRLSRLGVRRAKWVVVRSGRRGVRFTVQKGE